MAGGVKNVNKPLKFKIPHNVVCPYAQTLLEDLLLGGGHAESQPVSGLLECVAENKRPHREPVS